MVGLAWEQHVAFLDDPELARGIVAKVGRQVRECEAHPAILCYALGNEIPAPIVRWHGKQQGRALPRAALLGGQSRGPRGRSFTYVNYPSTEYLELPFLDLAAFNVFLEEEGAFESYLARLQNLSGDRPLLITEVGHRQPPQRRGASRPRCSTGRSGTRSRPAPPASSSSPGPTSGTAAATTWSTGTSGWSTASGGRSPRSRRSESAFAAAPFAPAGPWPRVSVIVCTHNGASDASGVPGAGWARSPTRTSR